MQRWILTLAMACSPATIDQPAPGKTEADTGTSDTADTDDTDTTDTGEPDDTDELAWPGDEWDEAEPEAHGFDSDLLDEAREYAFVSTHNTQAVVIIKDGVLIAEWYADDTDRDTPVTSWSTAKSFTSALFGVALREKLLALDEPIGDYMPDWAGETHEGISIRHLLEMRSGIEENTANEYGVYGEAYQLAYSLDRTPSWEPGVSFNYVNEDSMVLGGVLSAAFDREVGRVAQDEIFGPLGMDAAWWTDSSGHSLTWCCIDSTARDFARFGLLYARDGQWDGEQLVPSDFVAESTAGISYYGYYGMHWWRYSEAMFAAIGANGQNIYIYPDDDLVIARFGFYWQVGEETVRDADWENYHYTLDYGDFDDSVFLDLVLAAGTD